MPKDPEGLKIWNAMYDQWRETHRAAMTGRSRLTHAQIARAAGKGSDPAVAQVEEVERLEHLAAKLMAEMDAFVRHRLG